MRLNVTNLGVTKHYGRHQKTSNHALLSHLAGNVFWLLFCIFILATNCFKKLKQTQKNLFSFKSNRFKMTGHFHDVLDRIMMILKYGAAFLGPNDRFQPQ